MDYHVGQLVVCIDGNFESNGGRQDGMTVPQKGTVYRIRTLDYLRAPGLSTVLPFLRFSEIRNPPVQTVMGPIEPVFDGRSFLPLDPKRLAIFRQQLAPLDRVPA